MTNIINTECMSEEQLNRIMDGSRIIVLHSGRKRDIRQLCLQELPAMDAEIRRAWAEIEALRSQVNALSTLGYDAQEGADYYDAKGNEI